MNKIQTALKQLDVSNDNHWTADGSPRLDTVKMLASDPTITRDQIKAVAPEFSRANAATFDGFKELEQSSEVKADRTTVNTVVNVANSLESASEVKTETISEVKDLGGIDLEKLDNNLKCVSARLDELRKAKSEIDAELAKAQRVEDALKAQRDRAFPKESNEIAIQDYLATQRRLLDARAARQELIRASGLNLKELAAGLKSPIDSAMARKTGRGISRPGQR